MGTCQIDGSETTYYRRSWIHKTELVDEKEIEKMLYILLSQKSRPEARINSTQW